MESTNTIVWIFEILLFFPIGVFFIFCFWIIFALIAEQPLGLDKVLEWLAKKAGYNSDGE